MAAVACLDENDAIRLVLAPADDGAADHRAHLDGCEPCRELVATVARLVIDEDSRPAPPWGDDGVRPGTRLGAFRILEPIGRGAMGMVYLAEDERLHRRVALKLLRGGLTDEVALRRVRGEARSMARLRHPNVVEVLDVGRGDCGPFVAMQYIDGVDLRTWLTAAPRSVADILDHLRQAGLGLAAAHAAGIVHRDFKPANVLVGRDGRVRVADFGLAVLRRDDDTETGRDGRTTAEAGEGRATESRSASAIAGTPAYMAPEQLAGGAATPAADQFAFCVTLYEALVGERPRVDSPLGTRSKGAPDRRIPRRVAAALRRGLSPDPARRFADMPSLLAALTPHRLRRSRLSRLSRLSIGGVAIAAVIAGWAFGVVPRGGDDACDSLPEALAWHDGPRANLRAAWWARGIPARPTERILASLDEQAAAWLDARDDRCGTARASDATDASASIACLRAIGAEFETFVAEATAAAPEHSDGFARAADGLRSIEQCAATRAPSVRDPALAARASALRSAYVSAEARGATHEQRQLRPTMAEVLREAETAGDTFVQAELHHMLGVLETAAGDYAPGNEHLEQGYLVAAGAGYDDLAFDTALAHAIVSGSFQQDLEAGWRWTRHARAAAADLDDAERTVTLLTHEGNLHLLASDFDAADASFRAAERDLADDLPRALALSLYGSWGQLLAQQGDEAGCRATYQRAIEAGEAEFGPDHPDLLRPLIGIATCEMDPAHYDDAEAHLQRAIALTQTNGHVLGEAMSHGNLGLLLRNRERPTASLAELFRADVLFGDIYPPEHFERVRSDVNLAEAYVNVGRCSEAAAAAKRARIGLETQPFDTGSLVYNSELTLAWAELMLGETDMTIRFEALVTDAPTDNYRVEATIGQLQSLHADGRDAEAVRAGATLYAVERDETPAIAKLRWAEGQLLYAEALRATGNAEEADRQLQAALRLASPFADDDPRGVVAAIRAAAG